MIKPKPEDIGRKVVSIQGVKPQLWEITGVATKPDHQGRWWVGARHLPSGGRPMNIDTDDLFWVSEGEAPPLPEKPTLFGRISEAVETHLGPCHGASGDIAQDVFKMLSDHYMVSEKEKEQ